MSMFTITSLRKLLRLDGERPEIFEPSFSLTEREIALLRSFRASEEFSAFIKVLDVRYSFYSEQLQSPQSRDASVLHETRGVLLGLKESAFLVDKILHADNERTRLQSRAAESRPDPYASTLVNTPFWS